MITLNTHISHFLRSFVPAGLILLSGCPAANVNVSEADNDLDRHLAQCTAKYGHDQQKTAGLGEYELPPGEKTFLSCTYEGIYRLIIPNTPIPDKYMDLVDQHRKMTEAVNKKAMTRAQRKAKTRTLLATIKREEDAENLKRSRELQGKMDALQERQRLQKRQQKLHGLNRNAVGNAMIHGSLP